ncbi:SDR family NAD(P)-dependent oxidoreductase [Alishewanella sp. d11]|uniref:SDR family NAD(P)-dependent oxidoreductase n=1 Tax=Alishewanella sp. d11 TaxID=3414030 RepID=UPI003BF7A907
MSLSAHYPCLAHKSVFITGGATGIGAAMVRAFLLQGAQVAFVDLDNAQAEKLLNELSEFSAQLWFRCVDVRQLTHLQQAINAAAEHFAGLSVLINNVANDKRFDTEHISVDEWQNCLQINLDPAFFASQAAIPFLKKQGGAIINFSSINAITGQPNMAGYVTAKAGLIGLTKALARDYGGYGIRVNAILPGWVATERQLESWFTAEEQQRWLETTCIKQFIQPSDVANLALFLASEQSALITGQGINIDAGRI